MIRTIAYYFQLMKPRIMLLVVFSGATAMALEGSLLHKPLHFLLALIAVFLTGGSANALNQYFERDIDARMERTAKKRPLPMKRMGRLPALFFSITMGLLGVLIFGFFFNWYSAMLSLATILFYSLFYTLILKPTTPHNIVIGGAAGAMAPVGCWVAASGSMSLDAWLLFLIILLWTPPHFWALAMYFRTDYEAVKLPMMPVVKGNEKTLNQIVIYSWLLVAVTLTMLILPKLGITYGIASLVLGALFLNKSYKARRYGKNTQLKSLFKYSIVYLFVLLSVIVIDGIV